jgi:hypothetical protein
MSVVIPRYRNSCSHCVYLGSFNDCDLYYCNQTDELVSFSAARTDAVHSDLALEDISNPALRRAKQLYEQNCVRLTAPGLSPQADDVGDALERLR